MAEVTITRFRPIKLIAVIFTAIAVLLTVIGVAAADWVDVKFLSGEDARQTWGLWQECYDITNALTVCVHKEWMQACAALTMMALIGGVAAVVFGIVGLCTHKRLVYIIAGILTAAAALFLLISVIIFPVKFSDDIVSDENNDLEQWDFDWTYGITLGGLFFFIGASIFFFLKAENQEVSREKHNVYPPYYVNSSHS